MLWHVKNSSSKESEIYFLIGLVNDIPTITCESNEIMPLSEML